MTLLRSMTIKPTEDEDVKEEEKEDEINDSMEFDDSEHRQQE